MKTKIMTIITRLYFISLFQKKNSCIPKRLPIQIDNFDLFFFEYYNRINASNDDNETRKRQGSYYSHTNSRHPMYFFLVE